MFGMRLFSSNCPVYFCLMRAVTIDPDARTAHVQGGATAGDLMEAGQKHGLATATGTISSVGMAGFTLGGGYGPLTGAYGLGADNLLSAQVVTADGQLVTANADEEHADLLWGLRDGGGNFGVVVSLEYRLHPLTTVLSGLLEQAIAPLRTFDNLLVDQVQPVTYNALIHVIDVLAPKGRHYYIQTRLLKGLQTETIDVLIEQGLPLSSPFSLIELHNFHRAASRVGVSETAFALRQDHLVVELIAAWEPQSPDEEQRHLQWSRNISQALAPYAFKGGYINVMDEQEQERVPLALPNYKRLLDLKRKYDLDDVSTD